MLIISAGPLASECISAAKLLETNGVSATVIDPRWTQPINPALLSMAARYELVVTVEDGVRGAGMGTALLRDCSDAEISTPCLVLGLSDEFIEQGDRPGLLREQGLDSESIAECVLDRLGSRPLTTPPIAHLPRPHSPRPEAHRHVRS
ncbi:transketolase C-terminal domain-containing protein [Rhodococcus sp. TAF43]|uniref:transketolase C-terminal domain-containing protein n=1 Tax=Rhodococcus sp. TAF43 TaxID=3237483 RepID=UPI003F9DFAF0